MSKDEKNADAWNDKGVALKNIGKYERAIKCYDEAIKLKRDYHLAWNNKGIALFILRKYNKAIECFEEVLRIMPDYANAEKALGLSRKLKSE